MKSHLKLWQRSAAVLVLAISVGGVVATSALAQTKRSTRPKVRYYTLPANTVLRVRLNQELTSKTANVGDRFSATVTEPAHSSGGTVLIADGSKVWGRVTAVKRAGRSSPGTLTVAFTSVVQPNGRSNPINASLYNDESGTADNEGTVEGKSQGKRNAVFVGGGAAGGALIGAIAGGGKGAAIGALIGGGLGVGARKYEKEKDADVKSGTEFSVILNRAVSLPASTVR
jgi:hypothetical protein